MKEIAAVIPYYQTKPGILRRSISAVLKQDASLNLQVVIVDDASPVPASAELDGLPPSALESLTILTQNNSGAAAARNRALDYLDPRTKYVAFLDSDDVWTEVHLTNAISALEKGFDFYFSDFFHIGGTVSAFKRAVRAARLNLQDHKLLANSSSSYQYMGDMFTQIIFANLIGTSTVVYRFHKYPQLRFNDTLVYAGEDYCFWLALARSTDKFVFSTECECQYGRGVNIYSGSNWGTPHSLDRLIDDIKWRLYVLRTYSLTRTQHNHIISGLNAFRKSLILDIAHRLSHHKPIVSSRLFKHLLKDPMTITFIGPVLWAKLLNRKAYG
jgi:succinoglycan biosynthesis protein ExoW